MTDWLSFLSFLRNASLDEAAGGLVKGLLVAGELSLMGVGSAGLAPNEKRGFALPFVSFILGKLKLGAMFIFGAAFTVPPPNPPKPENTLGVSPLVLAILRLAVLILEK